MDAATVAREIAGLQDSARLTEPLTARDPAFGAAEAYAVSLELLRLRESEGWRRAGRKIGFTNRTIWDQYQVFEPIFGYMYERTITLAHGIEGTLSLSGMAQPLIEPEIVFRLRATPASDEPQALIEAVDWVGHGYEIVQCHFPDWKFAVADTIADGALHGQYLLGGGIEVNASNRSELIEQLATFAIDLVRDGELAASGGGALVLDSPLNALGYLVRTLATLPDHPPLEPGEYVTTGTLTTALPVSAGETWVTNLEGLTIPGLRVRFE